MALVERHLCARVREAWTDVGDVGVVRRADLGKSDRFSQILTTPVGWTLPCVCVGYVVTAIYLTKMEQVGKTPDGPTGRTRVPISLRSDATRSSCRGVERKHTPSCARLVGLLGQTLRI